MWTSFPREQVLKASMCRHNTPPVPHKPLKEVASEAPLPVTTTSPSAAAPVSLLLILSKRASLCRKLESSKNERDKSKTKTKSRQQTWGGASGHLKASIFRNHLIPAFRSSFMVCFISRSCTWQCRLKVSLGLMVSAPLVGIWLVPIDSTFSCCILGNAGYGSRSHVGGHRYLFINPIWSSFS